jgi:hypothetical protein
MGIVMQQGNIVLGNVYVFNATATQIYLTVNNGPDRLPIFPAATVSTWLPGTLRVPLQLCAFPEPSLFGIGENNAAITPASSGQIVNTPIVIPTSVGKGDALQLYFATKSTQENVWFMLCNGKPIAGDVIMN